jgi:hypothetical protein
VAERASDGRVGAVGNPSRRWEDDGGRERRGRGEQWGNGLN